jgi:PAS domain S-box-containing protein
MGKSPAHLTQERSMKLQLGKLFKKEVSRMKNLLAFVLVTLVIFTLFLPLQSSAQDDNLPGIQRVLKSASELNYPPFAIVQPDGSAGGFSVDLLKAVVEAAGLEVSFKVGPWHEIKEELATGVLDVLPLMSYSPERHKLYDFTAPYLQLNGAIFVRKGNTEIQQLSDLRGKEVLVMQGDTAHEYVEREKLTNRIIPTASYEEAFKLLAAGKHDGVVVQQIVGLQIIKKLGIKNVVPVQQKDISTLKPVALKLEGFEQKFCFAVQEGNSELLSKLNEGLSVIYLNGTYEKLYEKWFAPLLPKPQISTGEFLKYLLFILVPLLLLFALLGMWYLKRLVARKTGFLEQEIQQRKRIELELENANTKYIKAQQLGKIGNWDYNLNTQEFSGSMETRRIFGFDKDSPFFSTEEVEKCMPERERVHQALIDLIENDTPYNLEFDIITRDKGERRTIISLAEIERDESGNPLNVHGVIRDVTDSRKAVDDLQKSEQLLNEMGAIARIGGWEHDLVTHEATWTRETYKIVEIEFGPVPGPDEHLSYYPPEDRAILEKAYNRAVETETPFDIELQCTTAKGRLFWARVIGHPTFKDGKCIKMRGTFQDITERKSAEDVLRKTEGRFRILVETIPDLIWLKDKDGVFLACNPMFEGFYGIKEADIIGKTDYDFVDKELADFFIEHDRKAMAAGKPTSNEEWLTFANDGHRALHETIKTPMYDDCGTLIGVLGIARDITERKRAEEERVNLEGQLQQARKLEAIGVLAGGIAHDFNNILSAILGFTELAKNDEPSNQRLQEDLTEIYTAGCRAKELVQQLLTFSRRKKNAPHLLNIPTIVKEVVKFLRSTLPASIEIELKIDENVRPVLADPSQVHQIVMNLCSNAGQAMEEAGGILTIRVSETTPSDQFFASHPGLSPGGYIELIFQDTGTGIPPPIMGSIFDPYFTTKNAGDGTGLGLAVTYGIIRKIGGEIIAESEPGKGSIFTILLPIADRAEQGAESPDSSDVELSRGNERILLVDDEPQILKLTTRILEQYGYTVTTARDGLSALEMFKLNPLGFDLVISDVSMPKLSGDKLALHILAILPTMPILLASGYSKNISEELVMKTGVKGLLNKPVPEEQLLRKVRQVLDEN